MDQIVDDYPDDVLRRSVTARTDRRTSRTPGRFEIVKHTEIARPRITPTVRANVLHPPVRVIDRLTTFEQNLHVVLAKRERGEATIGDLGLLLSPLLNPVEAEDDRPQLAERLTGRRVGFGKVVVEAERFIRSNNCRR